MTNPSGIWPQPHAEDQFSHVVPRDSDACVSYSTVHVIESFIKQTLGLDIQFSERFLAKMSGTTLAGNTFENVFNTLRQYGLCLDTDWPEPTQFTWEEYYAPIPPEVIAKGQELFKYVDIGPWKQIDLDNLAEALKDAPLVMFTPAGTPTHAREVLSVSQVFDTYPPYVEALPDSIYGFYQMSLTPKNQMQLIRDNGTIFLVSSDKTSKIGIGNADVLTNFFPTEQVVDQDTSHIPQIGTLADGVVLHK